MAGTFPFQPRESDPGFLLRPWFLQVLDALLDACSSGRNPVRVVGLPETEPPAGWTHLHPSPEVFIQCDGISRFAFPEGGIDLGPGEVLVMPPLLAHRETVQGRGRFANLVVMLRPDLVAYHLARPHPDHGRHPVAVRHDSLRGPDARLLLTACEGVVRMLRIPGATPRSLATWFSAFACLLREILAGAPVPGEEEDRISRCKSLIAAYLGKPDLSVSLLARWLGCSGDHLGRSFHRQTGSTLVGWIARERMAAAQRLLSNSELPVRVVANTVGFRDPSYFARTFRRISGISPAEWRRPGPGR